MPTFGQWTAVAAVPVCLSALILAFASVASTLHAQTPLSPEHQALPFSSGSGGR